MRISNRNKQLLGISDITIHTGALLMRPRIPIFITVVALVVLAGILLVAISNQINRFLNLLPRAVEAELERNIHRQVSVKSTRISNLGTLIITGLRIANGKSFEQGTFFTAERVVIRINFIRFVLNGNLARNTRTVTLINPRLRLARNKHGVWNFEDLLRLPLAPPEKRFRGKVLIQSAHLSIVDYAARLSKLPETNTLKGISGSLDFGPTRWFLIDLAGQGSTQKLKAIRAFGKWGLNTPTTNLTLRISNANAAYWLDYLTDIHSWSISKGRFDARVVLFQPKGKAITTRGKVNLRNSSITSPYLVSPIRAFTADIAFVGTNLTITGHGHLNNSPLTVQGEIHGLTPSRLRLLIASERLNLETIQKTVKPLPRLPNLRWPSPAKLSALITGTTQRPVIKAAITVPHAVILGKNLTNLSAQGFYRDGVITINRLVGRAYKGNILLSSRIFVRSNRITASGKILGISLAAFQPQFREPISGFADAEFSIDFLRRLRKANVVVNVQSGKLGNLLVSQGRADIVFTGPKLAQAEVTISQSIAPGILIEKGTGSILLQNRTILIRHAAINTLKGQVKATGSLTNDGILNLQVYASNISLPILLQPFGYEQLAGIANFEGTLSGTISNPKLAGQINLYKGTLLGFEYDFVTGKLAATRQELMLENPKLRAREAEITTSGQIIIAKQRPPRAELSLKGRQLPLPQLVTLFNIPLQASGTASADLTITGSYPNLMAEGEVALLNTTVSNIPIDEARLTLNTVGRETAINRFYAKRGEMLITGSGTIGTSGRIEANLQGENLMLSLLNPILKPYFTLDGPVSFGGTITGTLNNPTISAMIESSAPIINSQPFEQLSANLSWNRNRLLLSKAILSFQTGVVEISQANYTKAPKSLDLLTSTTSLSIERLLAVLQNAPIIDTDQGKELRSFLQSIPKPTSGLITANALFTNIFGHPSGNISLTGLDVIIGGQEVGIINASARLSEGIWLIDQLQLNSESHTASIQGSIGPNKTINITGSGEDVPLKILGQLLHQPDLDGKLTFTLTATGSTNAPVVEMSTEAKNVTIRNLFFDNVTADRLIIATNRLSSECIIATTNSNSLVISGSIPFNFKPLGIPADQPIDIKVEIPKHDLSIFENLTPLIKAASGSLDMNLLVTGTFENPQLKGNLEVKDGVIRLDRFENDFTNLRVSATFENSVLLIDHFTGASSSGGTFYVGGNIVFPNLSSAVFTNFVVLNDLTLRTSNITGAYDEHMRLSATGQVTVTGELPSPLIQGQIVVNNALMEAPPEMPPSFTPTVHKMFNPRFDISLTLAENVEVRRGQLTASIVGPLNVSGNLSQPTIVGTFAIRKGTLSYPGRTFNLAPGGTATLVFQPPESRISVDVVANTRITTVSPATGRITRYTVNFDISGLIGNLDIDVTSSPPGLTREQALGLVFQPTQIEAFLRGEPFGQVLQRQLPQILLGAALPTLFEEFETGPFVIAIEPGFDIPLILNVSTSLTPKLSLTYSRSLVSNRLFNSLGISYTLSRRTDFTILIEDENEVTYLLQAAWRF